MNTLRGAALLLALAFSVTSVAALATPASSASAACNTRMLTFPAWYNNLTTGSGSDCRVKSPADFDAKDTAKGLITYVSIIALNVLEILLQLVVYICAGFIIYAGFLYIIAQGEASAIASAKKTILNALIGMVVALIAVFAVGFIAGRIGI